MYITHEDYDLQPLLIKQGALILWGISLRNWVNRGQVHHLYQLNEFYAEMCYDENTGRLTGIATFTSTHQLATYLDQMKLRGLPAISETDG
jgi:hypothetical protein